MASTTPTRTRGMTGIGRVLVVVYG
ncbi:MAG: hypothetical protein K0S37_4496, partial [Microbacterium sp.]|nr:hypothetical protein [Microbacterium sp.]